MLEAPYVRLQAVKVGTYAEALAAGGGGRPGETAKAAGIEAKRPAWHDTGPDVVKYIETTTPGKEARPQICFAKINFCKRLRNFDVGAWLDSPL